ncbi:hypothetical protein Sjap_008844 [Stephania japonica]|uniref:EF-hand domain-containing protein n=1 Tax=Stephania japonica TaxID=461633 RepID=A0AAP0PF20_9MAGN
MKQSPGTSRICPAIKSFFSEKVSGMCTSSNKHKRLDPKLERKLMEAIKRRASSGQRTFRSINSIIMRFPHFKEGLRNIKQVFEQYDKDSNGTIDRDEFNKCLADLHVHLTEKEKEDIFQACDVDGIEGIQLNEFIVLLCLVYLLMEPSDYATSKLGSQNEATFNAIVEAFLFFDKNGNGKLNRKELVNALNDASPWEKSPGHVNRKRFKEMDWTNSGKIGFKEFVFTLNDWVGVSEDDDHAHFK